MTKVAMEGLGATKKAKGDQFNQRTKVKTLCRKWNSGLPVREFKAIRNWAEEGTAWARSKKTQWHVTKVAATTTAANAVPTTTTAAASWTLFKAF